VQLRTKEPFEPARTLFVDDNLDVRESARRFGIRWLRAVRCPDSGRPPKDTRDFTAIDRIGDLF
jgi:5'-nucleotidase